MNRLVDIVMTLFLGTALLLASCHSEGPTTVIVGVIEPTQHAAMDAIVAGFKDGLTRSFDKPLKIVVENAQNDLNLEHAIIQKMHDSHYDVIVPIGLDASQMAASIVRDRPILSLASSISDAERKAIKNCNIAVVHDEIPSKKQIEFIHAAFPQLTHLTLIHSTGNKIFPEVKETIDNGKAYGITVTPKMINSLSELYTVGSSLSDQTQAIFVLKDHLVVSGISVLQKLATQKKIPLITSDQGSVQTSAGFALGVKERAIGEEGAQVAVQILKGAHPCDIPVREMKRLTVFINEESLAEEGQNTDLILNAARNLSYPIERVQSSERH